LNDRKLPNLERALDDELMKNLLAVSLRQPPDREENFLRQVRHRVLKYTPGKRCVIEYRLWFGDSRPGRVIGKLYRKNRGQLIFENWRQLWQATRGDGEREGLGMPEPLAYLPEIGMIAQSAVAGRPLAEFVEHADLVAAMRCVARNLSALHDSAVAVGEKKTLDDHIKKYCHPGPHVLIESCPEAAPLVEHILRRLAEDKSLPLAPICPVHGDLNLAQIFIAGDLAFFIDFDGLCLSPPALDIGNFLVTLQVHFGSASAALQNIFLENYNARRSLQMLTGLRAYQAFACLRRAVICARAPAVADWRQQVRQLLEAGSAFLENEN